MGDARITQAALLVLGNFTPCLTQRAQCWAITRADGVAHHFTTHDQAITFGGATYTPCASLSPSAMDAAIVTGGGISDTTIQGLISDDYISARDLAGGLYDNARVEVWLVPWGSGATADSPRLLLRGLLSEVSQGLAGYTGTVLSHTARLAQRPMVETYTPACRAEFGDARCKIDSEALRVTGTVTAVGSKLSITRASRRLFADTSRSEAAGFFDLGLLRWESGPNIGLQSEVKRFTAGGTIELWEPALEDIVVGHAYSIKPGCAKTKADCIDYGNLANFRGFPDIPGQDAITETPNAH